MIEQGQIILILQNSRRQRPWNSDKIWFYSEMIIISVLCYNSAVRLYYLILIRTINVLFPCHQDIPGYHNRRSQSMSTTLTAVFLLLQVVPDRKPGLSLMASNVMMTSALICVFIRFKDVLVIQFFSKGKSKFYWQSVVVKGRSIAEKTCCNWTNLRIVFFSIRNKNKKFSHAYIFSRFEEKNHVILFFFLRQKMYSNPR